MAEFTVDYDEQLGLNMLTSNINFNDPNIGTLNEILTSTATSMKSRKLYICKVIATSVTKTGLSSGTAYCRLVLHDSTATVICILFGKYCTNLQMLIPGDYVGFCNYERQIFNTLKEPYKMDFNLEYQIKIRDDLLFVPKHLIIDETRYPKTIDYISGLILHASQVYGSDKRYIYLIILVNNEDVQYIRLSDRYNNIFSMIENGMTIKMCHLEQRNAIWKANTDYTFCSIKKKRKYIDYPVGTYYPFVPVKESYRQYAKLLSNVIETPRYSHIAEVTIEAIAILIDDQYMIYSLVYKHPPSNFNERVIKAGSKLSDFEAREVAIVCIKDASGSLDCFLYCNLNNDSLMERISEVFGAGIDIKDYTDMKAYFYVKSTIQIIRDKSNLYIGHIFEE